MKNILLILCCLFLTNCMGLPKEQLLKEKPTLNLISTKSVEQYMACIKPVWMNHLGYNEEKLPNGMRLTSTPNPKVIRFLLDVTTQEKGSLIRFYDGTQSTFFLGDVMIPIENCAKNF